MHALIKSILPKSFILKGLDILVAILAIVALSYEISEQFPSEPVIILELEELEPSVSYALKGADSDQNYLLEYIKIYPVSKRPVKQATFKYDRYVKELKLEVSQQEQPHAYFVSNELLQNEFGKQGFQFEFLDDNRLLFNFEFDTNEQNEPEFDCKVMVVGKSVACRVVAEGWFSSWYYTMGLSVFILIIIVIFWLPIRLLIWKKPEVFQHEPNDDGILG